MRIATAPARQRPPRTLPTWPMRHCSNTGREQSPPPAHPPPALPKHPPPATRLGTRHQEVPSLLLALRRLLEMVPGGSLVRGMRQQAAVCHAVKWRPRTRLVGGLLPRRNGRPLEMPSDQTSTADNGGVMVKTAEAPQSYQSLQSGHYPGGSLPSILVQEVGLGRRKAPGPCA